MAETATANLVKFVACTAAAYKTATVDEGTLYFLTDTQQIFKGSTLYSGGIYKAVTEFPSASDAEIHTLYLNTTTNEVKFYNGAAFVTLVAPYSKELSKNSTNLELPTAKAVVDYVDTKVTADITVLENTVKGHTTDITELQEKMKVVQGDTSTEGSIAKAKQDAEDFAKQIVGALSTTVDEKADKATTLSGYGITDAYTKAQADLAISTAIGQADHLKRAIVDELPEVEGADKNTIYMVLKTSGGTEGNSYYEYMLINGAFEQIGDSAVDLTDYATKDEVDSKISEKVGEIGDVTVKSYVDGTVSTAKSEAISTASADATTKADAALSSAKSHADTKDAETLTSAKAYADGLAKNYATAAQGELADSALQKSDITTGSADGTISVDGDDVAVKGLGTAAFKADTAFDAAGAANSALTSAKDYADSLATHYATAAQGSKADDAYAALTWQTL